MANVLNWLKDKEVYKEIDAYKNSYCNIFFKALKNQIEFAKVYKYKEYIKKLKDILKILIYFSKKIWKIMNMIQKKKNWIYKDIWRKFRNYFVKGNF